MNGWFVVAFVGFVLAEWALLLLAYGAGFRRAADASRAWWAGKLDIERETNQRQLADEQRRCAAKVRGARFRAEPVALRWLHVDRNRSVRSN